MTEPPIELALPLAGPALVQNSPANRVPSHGTDRFGLSHAIDLVPVDDRHRSAPRGFRSWFCSEPAERFVGFGLPVLAAGSGVVVTAHDGEPDGPARRAPLVGLGYAITQARRVRAGVTAVAGNHVVIELDGDRGFLWLVHLRRGSVRVAVGEPITTGEQVGECGNSGNSTEPHVHLHVTDSEPWRLARGIPIAFRGYLVLRAGEPGTRAAAGLPRNGEIVESA